MTDGLALDAQTRQKISDIIEVQSVKPAQNQDWTGMYKAVSDFIRANPTAGFNAGIDYFFANAGDTNGQNPDAPSNFFIRTYYQGAARLQGVTLSDEQVQAVSGNIGLALATEFSQSGQVKFKIDDYVDKDIGQAVLVAPGLSMATWGPALFAQSKLGYTDFYQKYFTSDRDWDIFYSAAEAACVATAVKYPGQAGQGAADCIGVTFAAAQYYQAKQASMEAGTFDALTNAAMKAFNWLSDTLYPATSTTTPEQHTQDLNTIRAFAGTSVEGNQFVVNLRGGDGGTGTLAYDMESGASSLSYGGGSLTFVNGLTGIKQDPNGLVFDLEASQSGMSRAIDFNSLGGQAAIQLGNGSAVTIAAGSQISVGSDNVRASTFNDDGALEKQQDVFANGTTAIKYLDTRNTHPYTELDVSENSNGQITAAQAQLDQNIIAAGGSVGQIFGSALGRALAPNNQFAQLAVGTVAGLIGQKLLQTFTASLTLDASKFVAGDFASVSGLDVTNAGLGAISSFLTAELGHELGLTGFGAELFNGAVGGVTGSVLTQVATKVAAGYSFDAAVGFINWSTAATQAGYNVSAAVGSFLAHAFVPAESHEGAVGGQLFGAVGSALGLSAVINASLTGILGFLIPGLGSFFGTIVGTMLGDAIAGDPAYPKATHDIEIIGSDPTHFQNRLVGTDDHGNAAISQQMGDQVTAIANSYLDAVHGAAIAYSGKVMIGYNAGAAPYQYITGWFPNGTEVTPHFAQATDAIQEGVRELLVNTEVIGGDLLVKRAHQAFINAPHPVPTEISPDFSDLISLGGNLSVAQDYENYLNNREAINALMAANPDTAFTAGWIATFARVNDLGLNHMNASDFLGGVVGYLDSLNKAGLGAEAANATVYRGAGNSVVVEVKVAGGAEVPGALSVFADQLKISSNASGQTLQFTVDSGIVASGEHFLSAGASAGDGGNDLWIGGNGGATFLSTGGNDILIGGAGPDSFGGGAGFDFIDGGAGDDWIYGEGGNDILRGGLGNDRLFGDAGDDTYVFNRGDGADTVLDDYRYMQAPTGGSGAPGQGGGAPQEVHPDGGTDTLLFGPGISRADIVMVQSGNDLVVTIKDPAHPGAPLADNIRLQHWFDDPKDRVEKFAFADGAVLDLSSGVLGPYLVPFGESLSGGSVVEKSAIGTVVGTVTGFDFAGGSLSYSLVNPDGRFAINAATGVLIVAGAINYDEAHSLQVTARASDGTHVFDQPFTINVIDVPDRAPVLSVPASAIKADPGQTLQVSSWFSATDADNDALTYYFQDGTTAANSGHFALNGTPYAQGASFGLTAAQLAGLTFVAGAEGFPDDLTMQVSDGQAASAVGTLHINVNHAPVLSVPAANITTNPGQTLQVASLFNATDADNDALTYWFYDGSPAANSGHFVLNGTPVAANTTLSVTAAQLSQLTFVAGAAGVTDDLGMQLSDGHAVSAGAAIQVHAKAATPSDFNGDGTSDVFWRNNSTGHTGTWEMHNSVPTGHDVGSSAANFKAAGIGDFNADGTADVLWRDDSNGYIGIWEMHNNVPSWRDLGLSSATNFKVPGIGDFNGDGTADVLWRDDSNGYVGIWEMHNDVPAWRDLGLSSATNFKVAGIGDFNGDGTADILWRDSSNGYVGIWEMHNDVPSWRDLGLSSATNFKVAGIGDFNGDGTADVLWRDDSNGYVGIWEMHNDVPTWRDLGLSSATSFKVAGIGDYNGDGTSDIFWRNDSTGYVGIWEMHNNVPVWHDLGLSSAVDHSFIV
jgi:hypothetical protein